jgi:hypothetical protein
MQPLRTTGLVLVTTLAGIAVSRVARADDSAAAQALFDQAKKSMAAHRYAEACPKLEESLRLQEAVGTLLNLADCYEKEGKLASAWSKYLEVATKARAAGQQARARIGRDRAAALAPKLSNLVIDVATSRADGLEIRRDGTLVGEAEWGTAIPADAGIHTIEASAPARKPWSDTVVVTDGATTARVSVPDLARIPVEAPAATAAPVPESVPPEPVPAPSESRHHGNGLKVAALVAGGVGIAGVGVGSVFGVMSMIDHNDASNLCPAPGPCRGSSGVDAWHNAYDAGNVATIAFIAGGAGLAAGTVLWVLAAKSARSDDTTGQLLVGPGSVAWKAAW